ncbi:MAG: hypothetical protein AAF235_09905, partial [Planctomycetota bacterium]
MPSPYASLARAAAAVTATLGATLPVIAQDDAAAPAGMPNFGTWSPSWSSPTHERLAGALIGSWKSAEPVPSAGGGTT